MKRIVFLTFCLFCTVATLLAQDDDAKYATQLLEVGTTAPALTLPTINGETLSLNDFRGKYVVLEFWASWCPDCRKITPKVEELGAKYADHGVAFIHVSFDTNKEAWTQYVQQNCKNKQAYHVCNFEKMKESKVAKDFQIKWIPSFYLICPEGKIVMRTVMVEKIEKKLAELVQLSKPCCRLKAK